MPIKPENRARYPANWDEIVAQVRERSGNRCEGSPAFPDCRVEECITVPVFASFEGERQIGLLTIERAELPAMPDVHFGIGYQITNIEGNGRGGEVGLVLWVKREDLPESMR